MSTPEAPPRAPRVLHNLNALRAVAALAVVYSHITSEAGLDIGPAVGARGVDIFFVVSGFIIAYIASGDARGFFARRLIRIVPFYWAATLAVFALVMVFPHLLRSTQPDVVQLLCSLFFVPRETPYAGLYPTLVLGWSLNYEMYFYVVFSLCLLASRRYAPMLCSLAIVAIVFAIRALDVDSPTVNFYARTLVYEFVFGIVVHYLYRRVERQPDAIVPRPWERNLLLAMVAVALVAIFAIEASGDESMPRYLAGGVPATLIVLGALVLERRHGLVLRNRVLRLLGESSYILYLIHPYIVYGLLRTVLRHVERSPLGDAALVCMLLAIASAGAIAIHLLFEKPLIALLRSRLDRFENGRAARVMAPQAPLQPADAVRRDRSGVQRS